MAARLDREGWVCLQAIRNLRRYHRRIGKERHEEPFLLRILVDVEEILPHEDFPSCEEKPQAPGLVDLIDKADDLLERKLLLNILRIVMAIRITMDATDVTFIRQLNLTAQRMLAYGRFPKET